MKGFLFKFLFSLVLLFLILGVGFDMSFWNVFLVTLVLGVVSYFVGDKWILPRTNNLVASIADFGLAYLIIYYMSDALTTGGDLLTASLLGAIGVTFFECCFHAYVQRKNGYNENERKRKGARLNYQTETAEELYPDREDE